jgi:hypothetical protein
MTIERESWSEFEGYAASRPIELTAAPIRHCEGAFPAYELRWADGVLLLDRIMEPWLDLAGFMAARVLLAQGYGPHRLLLVRLQGVDYVLMRASAGRGLICLIANSGGWLPGLRNGRRPLRGRVRAARVMRILPRCDRSRFEPNIRKRWLPERDQLPCLPPKLAPQQQLEDFA